MPTQNVWDAAFAGNVRDVHRAIDCGAVSSVKKAGGTVDSPRISLGTRRE
eukprot:m.24727 g.24727  ORF g.24727 m.24727 type:complete len:50 (+) comp28674_c0_seq4:811-960(+)